MTGDVKQDLLRALQNFVFAARFPFSKKLHEEVNAIFIVHKDFEVV